jgi:hypothetical protein
VRICLEPCVLRIKGRFSIAGSYLQTLEKSLPHAKKVAIRELRAKAKAESWVAEEYFSDLDNLEHDFESIPNLAGSAFIAYLHGTVEHGLSMVCNRLCEKKNLTLRMNDLAGSPIERAKIYLTKLAGIRVGSDPNWSVLMDLAQLRHVILHGGGEVLGSTNIEKEIKRIQKRYPNEISIEDHDLLGTHEVCISLLLCQRLLSDVEIFFDRLFKSSGLEGSTIKDNQSTRHKKH